MSSIHLCLKYFSGNDMAALNDMMEKLITSSELIKKWWWRQVGG